MQGRIIKLFVVWSPKNSYAYYININSCSLYLYKVNHLLLLNIFFSSVRDRDPARPLPKMRHGVYVFVYCAYCTLIVCARECVQVSVGDSDMVLCDYANR